MNLFVKYISLFNKLRLIICLKRHWKSASIKRTVKKESGFKNLKKEKMG